MKYLSVLIPLLIATIPFLLPWVRRNTVDTRMRSAETHLNLSESLGRHSLSEAAQAHVDLGELDALRAAGMRQERDEGARRVKKLCTFYTWFGLVAFVGVMVVAIFARWWNVQTISALGAAVVFMFLGSVFSERERWDAKTREDLLKELVAAPKSSELVAPSGAPLNDPPATAPGRWKAREIRHLYSPRWPKFSPLYRGRKRYR